MAFQQNLHTQGNRRDYENYNNQHNQPNQPNQHNQHNQKPLCKFANRCTNIKCTFSHPKIINQVHNQTDQSYQSYNKDIINISQTSNCMNNLTKIEKSTEQISLHINRNAILNNQQDQHNYIKTKICSYGTECSHFNFTNNCKFLHPCMKELSPIGCNINEIDCKYDHLIQLIQDLKDIEIVMVRHPQGQFVQKNQQIQPIQQIQQIQPVKLTPRPRGQNKLINRVQHSTQIRVSNATNAPEAELDEDQDEEDEEDEEDED